MKKILSALLATAFFVFPFAAYAQVVTTVARTACGGQSLANGQYFPLSIDLTGNLCTSGSGGGGGGGGSTSGFFYQDRAAFTAGSVNFAPIGGQYNAGNQALTTGQMGIIALDINRKVLDTETNSAAILAAVTPPADESAYTQGTSGVAPIGGLYTSSPASLTSGQIGAIQATTDRMLYVNVGKFGGGAVTTGTGASGTGIPRVTISNDSSLAANQSTNVNQFGGSAVATGTGAGGAGIPRVTISNDSSLAANQSVNVSQVNATTLLTNTGATGAGSPRVTVATDSATVAGSASLPAGTNIIGTVNTNAQNPTSTLTLTSTTTAYTAGQLIASSATAGSVVVPSFTIAANDIAAIGRLRLTTNDATSTAWGGQTIRVDLWSAAPTWTNGDRGTWTPATNTAAHLAAFTCIMSSEFGDGAFSECQPTVGSYALLKLGGTSVFWSLNAITGSGVTGASKVFTLTAEVLN